MNDEIPGLRPIAAHLRPLVECSKQSDLSTYRSAAKTDVETALQRAQILLGCYRRDDAADPETYGGAVAAVLAEYPPDIVQRVTDPRSGIPSRSQWLPTVKEVRDACEEIDQRRRAVAQMKKREAEQLAARKAAELSRDRRPTYEELKAQYGENWGMPADARSDHRAEQRKAVQIMANEETFKAECRSAGVPEDSQISPSLAALIRAGMA
jgi:hypothetical protein